MDEHITREEMDRRLKDIPTPHRNRQSDWRGRMERIKAGEPLVFHTTDSEHAHILKCTAYQYAKQYGIRVKIRTINDKGQLALFIFLA